MTSVQIEDNENETKSVPTNDISKFGNVRKDQQNKKTSSFLSQLNVNVEEPNALMNIARELAEVNENLPMKARLSKNQIITFAKGYWYAFRYNCQTLVNYCDMQLILTVSESGKGRSELVSLSSAMAREAEVKAKSSDIKL